MNALQLISRSPWQHLKAAINPAVTRFNYSNNLGNISKLFSTQVATQEQAEPDKLYKLIELELRGNDPAVLKSYCKFAVTAGNHLNVKSTSWSARKPHHDRLTVLRSVHIYKKAMVQYEFRTYFSFIQFEKLTGSTADTLLEYIQRNLPEGVSLKTSTVELQPLPSFINEKDS
ncbi:28S ribosomal protein S10, mitochondrial [Aethina tumida]|uniref:28S ribosomal protein S10, mitochondrial n=1 Tax=Aethina tumida TaxID=116153 RepID=UPI00096B0817|nr:28S ribosomal protein S10, mitochondrial [Aethina tumida]